MWLYTTLIKQQLPAFKLQNSAINWVVEIKSTSLFPKNAEYKESRETVIYFEDYVDLDKNKYKGKSVKNAFHLPSLSAESRLVTCSSLYPLFL